MTKPVTIRRPYRPSDHVATETEDSPTYNPHRVDLAKQASNAAAPLGDLIKSHLDLARVDTPTLAKELARRLEVDLTKTPVIESPAAARTLALAHLGGRTHEVFAVMFLNAQHRLIKVEPMFRGTLTATSVYPREVVKEALGCHAAAVILAHNHPSGSTEPSRADEALTKTLKDALALVDVRVLDHFIVAGAEVVSFAERGLI